MASSIRIKIDVAKIVGDKVKAIEKALPVVAETIMADCNTYCRVDQGTLRESARVESGGKIITWNTPYAKRVYYTGTPSKDENANASLLWCERAKGAHAKDWGKRIEKCL